MFYLLIEGVSLFQECTASLFINAVKTIIAVCITVLIIIEGG